MKNWTNLQLGVSVKAARCLDREGLDGVIGHGLVLRALPGDAVLVLDQDPMGGEVELVPDGLEGHPDPLILEEEPGAVLPEFSLGFIRGNGSGVVEVHVDRTCVGNQPRVA